MNGVILAAMCATCVVAGCAQPATHVAHIAQPVRAAAPALPQTCGDSGHDVVSTPASPRYVFALFTSDWCTACDRLLGHMKAFD